MTEIQERMIELLDEIDDACKQNDLKYWLAGANALEGYLHQAFESKVRSLSIYMTLPDALKLQEYLLNQKRDDREVESLYTNDDFPNLMIKYCNTNTLYINLSRNSGIKCMGMAVTIIILRKEQGGIREFVSRVMENGWIYNYEDFPTAHLSEKRKRIMGITAFGIRHFKKQYKNLMLHLLENGQRKVQYADELYRKPFGKPIRRFKGNLFNETQFIEIEGKQYPIPKDVDKFFNSLYGLRWKMKEFKQDTVGENIIVDPNLPYKTYFEFLGKNNINFSYHKERLEYAELKKLLGKQNKPIRKAWNFVLRTGARIAMWEKYMPQKEIIKELRTNEKWNELKEIFAEYDEVVQKNYRNGLGVCFDKEIFEIYQDMLVHYGEVAFSERLKTLIPECHWKGIQF